MKIPALNCAVIFRAGLNESEELYRQSASNLKYAAYRLLPWRLQGTGRPYTDFLPQGFQHAPGGKECSSFGVQSIRLRTGGSVPACRGFSSRSSGFTQALNPILSYTSPLYNITL